MHRLLPALRAAATRQPAAYACRGPIGVCNTPFLRQVRAFSAADTQKAEIVEEPAEETKPTETIIGAGEKRIFAAETKQLLDIVAKSLYTDTEVFVRELISNSSDALEKRRHAQLIATDADGPATLDVPLEIRLVTDKDKNTLVIQDFGIGMSKEEMIENLGTIARSGSKAFLQQLSEEAATKGTPGAAASNIIGQFGVGFYSVFMVAEKVEVFSRKAIPETEVGHCWTSVGDGSYEVFEATGVDPGTKIVIHLKDDHKQFSQRYVLESNIKKYSSFVGFPVVVDGDKLNTVEALWTKSPREVTEEEHTAFYKYVAQAWDDPQYTLHFQTDAPIDIKSLFYFPSTHSEKWGMGRMDQGVNLYSRKVLIKPKCEEVLPQWLRFVKGVVDSEDIPLNISRENMQDSALLRKMNQVLSKRIIKHLSDNAKKDPEKYLAWYADFNTFLKEGVCADFQLKGDIAKLLRFESSTTDAGLQVSLDDYIGRIVPEQQDTIYYLVTPNRAVAETSAYMEAFKKKGFEVLYMYQGIDEFVMSNLMEYSGKKLVSAEHAKLDVDSDKGDELSEEEAKAVAEWMQKTLGDKKVKKVSLSTRLVDSPAVITDHESASMRRMMAMVQQQETPELAAQVLEINPSHTIIKKLMTVHKSQPGLAKDVASQVFDNALITAGLMDDPRSMLPRVNALMEGLLDHLEAAAPPPPPETEAPASEASEAAAAESSEPAKEAASKT